EKGGKRGIEWSGGMEKARDVSRREQRVFAGEDLYYAELI
ncbi:unnamed protein product, partial [Urochloa humidicola]